LKFSATVEQSLSQISTNEGTSSICDSLGNLLFYTDGVTVWNNQDLVIDGSGSLSGSFSSTQSALIVPYPKHEGQYYIFTTSSAEYIFNGEYSGAAYSILDLNLNGGQGQITALNIELIDTTCEKITGIETCNGDYWIIAHEFNSSNFLVWKLTEAGLEYPKISNAGMPITTRANIIGNLQLSHGGKRLASANRSRIELFNFNQVTGEITDNIFEEIILNNDTVMPYGVCFSPNDSLLYVTGIKSDYSGSVLIQYNANAANSYIFRSSQILIKETNEFKYMGDIELSPNGIIYIAASSKNYLNSINNPNVTGINCNFIEESILLDNGCLCKSGLHNGITLKKKLKPISIGEDTVSCTQVTLVPNLNNDNTEYLWSTGDSSETLAVNTSNDYWLMVYNIGCSVSDTVKVVINPNTINLKIPNVFTPNGDSINDYFDVEIKDLAEFKISVFNRWGFEVFKTDSPIDRWNGRFNDNEPIDGVYFWECIYKGFCDEITKIKKGTVTIIK